MPSSPFAGDALLRRRFAHAREYLEMLHDPPWASWMAGYQRYSENALSLAASLLLAHPMWLVDKSRTERVYGPRLFKRAGDAALHGCSSEAVWGYPCRTPHQPVQFDHRFPYAFGGPTEAPNRLSLCAAHNATKSHDVHLFAWEDGLPVWLDPLLRRIEPWTHVTPAGRPSSGRR